mmetsp:Transcript_113448/g.225825  ORF Transcript_113448/g.225825 Transcript_113448/m.225825 type:complete len:441 (-) Transcript_113448:65-1387(-)|eukprot:CAMPEP_0172912264 /NCGR_PEP_ID=MMETSP1075-20121228/188075_1 /TAXON_ID=2916 /ORGANISM="Ceratium fusus, Strain PA161109" /LENGTH=440 /DNA_ID=CAMNT_0013770721 /DNA_START=82 /DNA_END=1404 /DNA_ORIENTATION=+
MGAVADRCSDMSPAERHASFRNNSRGMSKPLDYDSSEEEEDEEGDDEGSDMAESEAEEMRAETELALREGLTRNSAATFHEVIDHARGLGIDPEKIKKAEQMLEQHRAQQRRDLFEADMKEFLETSEADNLDACKEKLDQGRGYGCSEKLLQPLRSRISELELCIDLAADEVAKAKRFLELCTRRFVRSCVTGRDTIWVDLKANKRTKAVLHLDVVLKNFTVKSAKGDKLATAKVVDLEVKRALDVESISSTEAFGKLPEKEKQFGVVLVGEEVTWLIGENNRTSQDEFLLGLAVLNRRGVLGSFEAREDKMLHSKPKATPKMSKMAGRRSGSMLADDVIQEEVPPAADNGEEREEEEAEQAAIENNEPQDDVPFEDNEEDIGFQEVEEDAAAAQWQSEEEPPKSAKATHNEAEPEEKKEKKEKKDKKDKKEKKHKKESK